MESKPPDPDRWSRVESVLDRVLDAIDEAARQAVLEEVRQRDPEIVAEIEQLLAAMEGGGGALDRPLAEAAPDLVGDLRQQVRESAESSQRGRMIGSYRLLEILGRGGMGVVYVAERADEQYEQQVAVKLMPSGLESPETVRRFLNERQILANLQHPNIARLLDGGVTGEGFPYLVMELIDGAPISDHCTERRLGLEQRLELFLQVCEAVQHAHQQMVIHRDLKPSNILVTPEGQAKLLDFGIARLDDPAFASEGNTTVFQPRSIRYASPEQIANQPVAAASDVYSLGVVLYELLTDRAPYELDDLTATEVETTIRQQRPEPPSAVVSRWKRRLSGDLDNIALKALRKDPERRYGTVADLAADVRRYLEGKPVEARPSTLRYRASKFARRHRLAVALGTVAGLLLVLGVGAIAWQGRIAALERDRAEEAASFVLEFMTLPDPDQGGGTTITARELLDQSRARANDELAGQPELQVRILEVIAEGYFNLGVFDEAVDVERQILATLGEGDGVRVAVSRHDLGMALAFDGQGDEAVEQLERAIEIRRNELGEQDLSVAEVLGDLAQAISVSIPQNDPRRDRMAPLLLEAIDIHRAAHGGDHPELAENLHLLGMIYFWNALSDPDGPDAGNNDGELLMREALAMRRRLFGDDGFPVAETLNDLGLGIDAAGRPEEAMVLLTEALAIHRKAMGADHPDSIRMLNNVAAMHRDAGEFEQAEPLYRECLELWRQIHSEDDVEMTSTIYGLGVVQLGLGQLDDAEATLRRLVVLLDNNEDDVRLHITWSVLGEVLSAQGRYREAEPLLESSAEGLERIWGEAHPEAAKARARLATMRAARSG